MRKRMYFRMPFARGGRAWIARRDLSLVSTQQTHDRSRGAARELGGGVIDDVVFGAVLCTQALSKASGQQSQACAWRIPTALNKLSATPLSRGTMLKCRWTNSSSVMNFI